MKKKILTFSASLFFYIIIGNVSSEAMFGQPSASSGSVRFAPGTKRSPDDADPNDDLHEYEYVDGREDVLHGVVAAGNSAEVTDILNDRLKNGPPIQWLATNEKGEPLIHVAIHKRIYSVIQALVTLGKAPLAPYSYTYKFNKRLEKINTSPLAEVLSPSVPDYETAQLFFENGSDFEHLKHSPLSGIFFRAMPEMRNRWVDLFTEHGYKKHPDFIKDIVDSMTHDKEFKLAERLIWSLAPGEREAFMMNAGPHVTEFLHKAVRKLDLKAAEFSASAHIPVTYADRVLLWEAERKVAELKQLLESSANKIYEDCVVEALSQAQRLSATGVRAVTSESYWNLSDVRHATGHWSAKSVNNILSQGIHFQLQRPTSFLYKHGSELGLGNALPASLSPRFVYILLSAMIADFFKRIDTSDSLYLKDFIYVAVKENLRGYVNTYLPTSPREAEEVAELLAQGSLFKTHSKIIEPAISATEDTSLNSSNL